MSEKGLVWYLQILLVTLLTSEDSFISMSYLQNQHNIKLAYDSKNRSSVRCRAVNKFLCLETIQLKQK